MSRVYNFSAGPAALPESVLRQASEEMLDWNGTGMSVMEMSHRGKAFMSIAEQAEADLRTLLSIPDNYKVLFMQGGASAQFSLIPMNLLPNGGKADYINTGAWSKKAIAGAKPVADVHVAASSEAQGFSCVPDTKTWDVRTDASYLHYTTNETIGGVEFHEVPDVGSMPLIADMSSNILSRPVDVSQFALIYAGAQKNIGPAGLTLVIIRDDLIGDAKADTPDVFKYSVQAAAGSMSNTPPTYGWYLAGLVFQWLLAQGGLSAVGELNERKAAKLYKAIDDSPFYANPVAVNSRSIMNVPFTLANADLDKLFLEQAESAGLTTLKGHRSVGGMRASIYNAMPESGIDALIAFMVEFERSHG